MPLRNTLSSPVSLFRLALTPQALSRLAGSLLLVGLLASCEYKPPASEAPPAPVLSPEQAAEREAARQAAQAALDAREQALLARYLIPGDGTVTDTETGLTWMQCSLGQSWSEGRCQGEAKLFSWTHALRAAEGFEFAGHADWRLPTQPELLTLVYCSSGRRNTVNAEGYGGSCAGDYGKPTLLTAAFPDTPAGNFWTSTPHERYGYASWGVAFGSGATGIGTHTDYTHARLVRGTLRASQ
ncbi:DUF1566 domain-containing protein [Thauera sp. WH-1]|uniref:Lcl C-terminal domain-containing protein n=1 Tax=Thauera sp. WH-1 TaxID=3398230 RepID=UPI0039FC2D25